MKEQLVTYLRVGYAGVYIQTYEEARAESEVAAAAKELGRQLLVWTLTAGLYDPATGREVGSCKENPRALLDEVATKTKVVVLAKDLHPFLDDPGIWRRIRDVLPVFKADTAALVLLSPLQKIPPELAEDLLVLPFALPSREALDITLGEVLESAGEKVAKPTDREREAILAAASGLTSTAAADAFALSISETVPTPRVDPEVVIRMKAEALRKGGILELYPRNVGLEDIGGLLGLKEWLRVRSRAFGKEAEDFGLPKMKGLMLAGVAGGGKSLAAKAIAKILKRLLLRWDVGRSFGSLVGQSEANVRQALAQADAQAPCVLWVDEVEKAFAGATGASQLDSGVGSRVFGTFITWMQEHTSDVFVVATCNRIEGLPPEFLRKGRFDELFFVDLPNEEERLEILEIHLRKVRRDPSKVGPFLMFQDATRGFTGAEIESCVQAALFAAFDAGREVSATDINEAVTQCVPLSQSMKEEVQRMRKWAEQFARPANVRSMPSKGGRRMEV